MEQLPSEGPCQQNEKKYWCHQCHFEFKQPAEVLQVYCFKCKGDFCEEIVNEDNDPRKFIPYTAPSTAQGRRDNGAQNFNQTQGQNTFRPLPQRQLPVQFGQILNSMLGFPQNPVNSNRTTFHITNFQFPSPDRVMLNQLFSAIFPNSPSLSLENYFESALQHIMQNDPNAYGNPPASVQAVQSLPTLKVDEDFFEKEGAKECTVCKEDFKSDEILKELPCKHRFHDGCILPWLKQHNSCPTCRFELPTDDPDFESRKLLRANSNQNQRTNGLPQSRPGPPQQMDSFLSSPSFPIAGSSNQLLINSNANSPNQNFQQQTALSGSVEPNGRSNEDSDSSKRDGGE